VAAELGFGVVAKHRRAQVGGGGGGGRAGLEGAEEVEL
jgi:hypothetical protein